MTVKIFTCNSFEKVHPRIQMQEQILKANGYKVKIIKAPTRKDPKFQDLLNLFSLKYFRKGAIKYFASQIEENDIVHIYDFQLLPLAKIAKKKKCRVIYETLDDNVHLHFYALQKLIPGLSFFENAITRTYAKKEYNLSNTYCDAVIVNSSNLIDKFNKEKVHLIYYASNLTVVNKKYNPNKEVRFVYMGKLTKDKGAIEYSMLINQFNIPLIFYGHFGDSESKTALGKNELVRVMGNMDIQKLNQHLEDDINNYNLIGLSIIHPINESYRMQEANKDIDYITINIPFIGNDRPPTLAKIDMGCGVLNSNNELIPKLISNKDNFYDSITEKDKEIVKEFSRESFAKKLISVYK